MSGPAEISAVQLNRLIGTPEAPIVVDICIDEDFALNPLLVPGSFRHSHKDLDGLMDRIASDGGKSKRVVVVCQKGMKLSQGVAAILRARGIAAEALTGGQLAWCAAGMMTRNGVLDLPINGQGSTRWVTRHRPKIDRLACPWLIRRFVDPGAEFLFVPPRDVEMVAEKFDAQPFDIDAPNQRFSHVGEGCTFDAMLADFGLKSEALERVAEIVRGADTDRLDLRPQSAGLLAFSVGLSRMFKDDMEQLDAGMLLYDALYRWARDGQDEGHDWPGTHSAPRA